MFRYIRVQGMVNVVYIAKYGENDTFFFGMNRGHLPAAELVKLKMPYS